MSNITDQLLFIDVDECAEERDDCHVMSNATCSDTDGSFYCNCTQGFTGNGTFCEGTVLLIHKHQVELRYCYRCG